MLLAPAQPNVGDKKLLSQILRLVASCEGQLPPADFSSVLIPLCRHSECGYKWPFPMTSCFVTVSVELRPVCVDCLTSSSCGGRGFSGLAIHCCLPPVYLSMQVSAGPLCSVHTSCASVAAGQPVPVGGGPTLLLSLSSSTLTLPAATDGLQTWKESCAAVRGVFMLDVSSSR